MESFIKHLRAIEVRYDQKPVRRFKSFVFSQNENEEFDLEIVSVVGVNNPTLEVECKWASRYLAEYTFSSKEISLVGRSTTFNGFMENGKTMEFKLGLLSSMAKYDEEAAQNQVPELHIKVYKWMDRGVPKDGKKIVTETDGFVEKVVGYQTGVVNPNVYHEVDGDKGNYLGKIVIKFVPAQITIL
ncbi:hypothetical protein [Phthorimaea operculella granulovirus]|uniref:Uncharacterized protein n=1 Tax=Phthorimaea operculella granulovirus TaxID=192584 RepID=Q8JRZ5_9BBAC|nr:hypothetical protein [Phthorimaea operculella granulovirus]AAM70262.1 hypothetical protein [Phthorimaea operculella granulovirus]ANY57453.1 hypothetical protein PhopGVgp064 [Phthorimaea operculella granulovirus]QBH65899.1 hypothetical protein PhopGVgp064 [Phthorimaea operculella granulovirus]QBH66029.1 hypothetical protein PhopGVgp064 [Phthorimaea operculella granulovirus]QBH66159.1 hypothetical protein PhopGVgp064 [Phthorimaea operculella granulovirus]